MQKSAPKTLETYNQVKTDLASNVRKKKLSPILKWAGGKEKELKHILPNLPTSKFHDYYEPFVGGGAVYTAIQADKYFINDKSDELTALYRNISNRNRRLFFKALDEMAHNWNLLSIVTENNSKFFANLYNQFAKDKIDSNKLEDVLIEFILSHSEQFNGMFSSMFNFNIENFIKEIKKNLTRKIRRMKQIEKQRGKLADKDILDNIETALKSAFYMHFRHIYNNTTKYRINNAFVSAIFFFIRNFAYSAMFRYNSKGQFNVPYGGIAYNKKNFQKKIDYLKSRELKSLIDNTIVVNEDFERFIKDHKPKKNDFIFLDPPYDSEFSTYAKNEFSKNDQERLANYLIHTCKAKWMLIVKKTDFIFELYRDNNLNIKSFKKTYLVSFMNRNDKNSEHLLITNY